MQERKRPGKTTALPELRSTVAEILVVNGRSFQPFIRTFSYTGENITKSNLGTLVGVFEIDEMSEDSAYIVNFLASVAKKEYFSNPRRGAIESFEAALHKINLALAELVKHGNVSWLGKFHGAIGVLEKNNFHFSVTGKGTILLFRNELFSDIGVDLASEESKTHPIKTFVEVSSGRLALEDQIILASPELLALFTMEDLTKNARRMEQERFSQFLKTALVNELDLAGVLIIDISEEKATKEPQKAKRPAIETSPEKVQNVFSQVAFSKKEKSSPVEETLPLQEESEKKEEYVDTKTGHIYVQGEALGGPVQHPAWEKFLLSVQEATHALGAFMSNQGRLLRKAKKQSGLALENLKEESVVLGRKSARSLRRFIKKHQEAKKQAALERQKEEEIVPPVSTPSISVSDIPLPPREESRSLPTREDAQQEERSFSVIEETPQEKAEEIPFFMKEKLASFYQRKEAEEKQAPAQETTPAIEHTINTLIHFWEQTTAKIALFLRSLSLGRRSAHLGYKLKSMLISVKRFFRNLSPKQRRLWLGGTSLVLVVGVGTFLVLQSSWRTKETDPQTATENPVSPLSPSTNNTPAVEISTLINPTDSLVTSVVLNDEVYAVNEKNVTAVSDKRSFSLPGGESALYAAAMDDLRLLFVYTRNGRLYAFSPISKTFVENTLSLPEGSKVTGIGTYLTYLYVLDSNHDQIYRFPRADGGFGASATWLKDTIAVEDNAHLSVNETIFLSPNGTNIDGFFRGRKSVSLEAPEDGLTVASLYTSPDLVNVYALDADHHRLFVWNQEGKLLKTYENEKFSDGYSLSVNEKTIEAFIGTENSLLSFKLK